MNEKITLEDFPNLPKIDELIPKEQENLEFEVFWKEELLATVKANLLTQEVRLQQFTDNPIIKPFPIEPVTIYTIMQFFETRCFPKTRKNCQQLLQDLGLEHYNPQAIVRKTHGLQFEDYMWIRFKGDDTQYADIKIRD